MKVTKLIEVEMGVVAVVVLVLDAVIKDKEKLFKESG